MQPQRRWIHVLLAVIVVVFLCGGIAYPLVSIELRLWRNRAIAARLVESLRTRFPAARFRGNVSYEREVIYISVLSEPDPESRPDIERWLRGFKSGQGIAPEIWLLFPDSTGEEKDVTKI